MALGAIGQQTLLGVDAGVDLAVLVGVGAYPVPSLLARGFGASRSVPVTLAKLTRLLSACSAPVWVASLPAK